MADAEPSSSYIDYDTLLSPHFSPTAFANALVLSTNDASDTTLDLSTPLSRVLFDVQEIDTHMHSLTTGSALELLAYTRSRSRASQRVLDALSAQVASLTESYARLEEEVVRRHAVAEQVRLAASRLWVTVRIGRGVSRALVLGRQLDAQMADVRPLPPPGASSSSSSFTAKDDDHAAMVRAAYTILSLRQLFAASGPGEEGEHLHRIAVVSVLRADLLAPAEHRLRSKAQQTVREFSLSPSSDHAPSSSSSPLPPPPPTTTYAQTEETKSRTASALRTLYLLSLPLPRGPGADFRPGLLLAALQAYLHAALTSSLAGLARALAQLPALPRALHEVAARCRNVAALEHLLAGLPPPEHPLLLPSTTTAPARGAPPAAATAAAAAVTNLLAPLLAALDTSSLPSFFWRSLASGLSGRVEEIVARGGAGARALRAGRDVVRDSIRGAVLRGCEGARSQDGGAGGWEREVGVMVGSVVGALGR